MDGLRARVAVEDAIRNLFNRGASGSLDTRFELDFHVPEQVPHKVLTSSLWRPSTLWWPQKERPMQVAT